MADKSNIFAYTSPAPDFPDYISINAVGTTVIEVTVRPMGRPDRTAAIDLTPDQARELAVAILAKVPQTPTGQA